MPKISPTNYKVQVKIFEKLGFVHVRTKGDHLILEKDSCLRPIVIPKYKEIPVFIINNNLRSAGVSNEEYFKLL